MERRKPAEPETPPEAAPVDRPPTSDVIGTPITVTIEQLVAHPDNIDRQVEPADAEAFAESIHRNGIKVPIVVRQFDTADEPRIKYQILDGHRRWRAAYRNVICELPALLREMTDNEAREFVLLANAERADLSPFDAARMIDRLHTAGRTYADIASLMGRGEKWVYRRARLSSLDPKLSSEIDKTVKQMADWGEGGIVPLSVYERLAALPAEGQQAIAKQLADGDGRWLFDPKLCDRELAETLRLLSTAPWKLDDAALLPAAGSCAECPKRTDREPMLFDDLAGDKKTQSGARCTDPSCWAAKLAAHNAAAITRHVEAHGAGRVVVLAAQSYDGRDQQKKDASKLAQKAGVKTADKYQMQPAKKDDPAALCAFDPTTGRIDWRKPYGAGGVNSAKAPREKGKARSLADRRKELEARRKAHVIRAMAEALSDAGTADLEKKGDEAERATLREIANHLFDDGVVLRPTALLLAFGIDYAHRSLEGCGKPDDPYKEFERLKNTPESVHELEALKPVCRIISARLAVFNLQVVDRVWAEAQRASELLGIDLDAIKGAADEAIPEPKSWAGLSDGVKAQKTTATKKHKEHKKSKGRKAVQKWEREVAP